MSNIRDRGVIDITIVEDGKYILIICDDMEWNFGIRQQHALMLQSKINDYLDYVASGQAEKANPGLRPVIRILAKYPYSAYCLSFLGRVREFIKSGDDICDIEWTHPEEDGPYDDGFSDDYVFDEKKIFPRLKKNWAKDPLKEVSLMAANQSAPDYSDQMVMVRFMDSFIGMFVQDMGNVLSYLTYDMLPEGTDIMKLQEIAFDNLVRDITYKTCESKEPGVYGILAGGDFEAESLCVKSIWHDLAESMGDDLVICVPTKDIVLYTKASDKKLVKKALKQAHSMFESNRKETPHLLFCKDVFVYSRADGTLSISKKLKF